MLKEDKVTRNEKPLSPYRSSRNHKNIIGFSYKHLPPASAKKIATESKIDLTKIKGSGKNGIILKEDLLNLMGSAPQPSQRKTTHGPEERIKMTRLRMTIAKRLKEAQENAAMLTTFNEVDMSTIISMRNEYKEEFQKKYSVKLGFMSFFVKACVVGLKNYPIYKFRNSRR